MDTAFFISGAILLGIMGYGLWKDRQRSKEAEASVKVGAVFAPCYGDDNPFTRKKERRVIEEIRENYVKFGFYSDDKYTESGTMNIASFLIWHYPVEE